MPKGVFTKICRSGENLDFLLAGSSSTLVAMANGVVSDVAPDGSPAAFRPLEKQANGVVGDVAPDGTPAEC